MPLARWQATITNARGDVQPGARIEVRHELTNALPVLYSDRNGSMPLSSNGNNPFSADGDGFAAFHVAGGPYRITATLGAYSRTWRWVPIGTSGESDSPPFSPRGEWDTGAQYDINNVVVSDGSTYWALQPSLGIEPGVTEDWGDYWSLMAAQGGEGDQGARGYSGWSPALGAEVDGDRVLLTVAGWVGSEGSPPDPGSGTNLIISAADTAAGAAALSMLNGEEGVAFDFRRRSFAANDYAGDKSALGRTDDFLTVTRASTASYVGRDGLIHYAAPNELRYDHDPITGEPSGALLEGSGTNRLLWSAAFEHAAWTKNNASIAANAAIAPDGTNSFAALIENNANSGHDVQIAFGAATSGDILTGSAFLEANGRTRVRMRVGRSNSLETVVFDLSNGTVVSQGASVVTAGLIQYRNDVWRVWMTVTIAETHALQYFNLTLMNAGLTVYAGDGVSGVSIWGADLKAGAGLSSYIPTTGSSATRAADVVGCALERLPWGTSQGTIVVNARWGSASETCVALTDGSDANRVLIRSDAASAANVLIASGGETVASLVGPNISARPISRIAAAWRGDDFAASFNGNAAQTDNAGATPAGMTTLQFGAHLSGERLLGHVRSVMLFSRRATNAELQSLTA